jgi:uncharacterized protein (DUF2336 family)
MVLSSAFPELEEVIQRGSPERLQSTLRRLTTLFLEGATRFNDEQIRVFDQVLGPLLDKVETGSRAEVAQRLAPVANAPIEVVRCLAADADISVAGPVLERSPRLAEGDLLEIARTMGEAHRLAIARRKIAIESESADVIAPDAARADAPVPRTAEAARRCSNLDQSLIIELARSGRYHEISWTLAETCAVPIEVVERLMAGERPDPVLVLCKSAGFEWPATKAVINACPRMRTAVLNDARTTFERLSPATAHRVMRFWQRRKVT